MPKGDAFAVAVVLVCLALIACRAPLVALAAALAGTFAAAERGRGEKFGIARRAAAPFLAAAPGPPDAAAWPGERPGAAPWPGEYPGAVPSDALGTLGAMAGLGHPDRAAPDAAAPEGNPSNPGRTAAPWAAPPCVDDEANAAEMDVDEGAARSALARNEPTRPAAGTIRRKKFLDPFLREEVEEFEELPWYGRHEL
jgi:hypothetical protein